MSKRGIDFLNDWISKNIKAESDPVENETRAKEHVRNLTEAAKNAGIPMDEMREDMGSLTDQILEAMEEAAQREVASRDA